MQSIPLRYLVWTQKRYYDRLVSTSPHLRILWKISPCSHRKTSGSLKIRDVIEKNRSLPSASSPSIPHSCWHFVLWVHLCHGSWKNAQKVYVNTFQYNSDNCRSCASCTYKHTSQCGGGLVTLDSYCSWTNNFIRAHGRSWFGAQGCPWPLLCLSL